jgi:hypothetical protein
MENSHTIFKKQMGKIYRFEGDFSVVTEVILTGSFEKVYIEITQDVIKPNGESFGKHYVSIAEHQFNDLVDILIESMNVAIAMVDHENN